MDYQVVGMPQRTVSDKLPPPPCPSAGSMRLLVSTSKNKIWDINPTARCYELDWVAGQYVRKRMKGRVGVSVESAPEFPAPSRDGSQSMGVPDLTPEDGCFRAGAKQLSGLPMWVEQLGGGRAELLIVHSALIQISCSVGIVGTRRGAGVLSSPTKRHLSYPQSLLVSCSCYACQISDSTRDA